jgi:hypothetical protein
MDGFGLQWITGGFAQGNLVFSDGPSIASPTLTGNPQLSGNIYLNGAVLAAYSSGTDGQVLTTTGSGVEWRNAAGGGMPAGSFNLTSNSITTIDESPGARGVTYFMTARQGNNTRYSTLNIVYNNLFGPPFHDGAITETNVVSQGSGVSITWTQVPTGQAVVGPVLRATVTNASTNPVVLSWTKQVVPQAFF